MIKVIDKDLKERIRMDILNGEGTLRGIAEKRGVSLFTVCDIKKKMVMSWYNSGEVKSNGEHHPCSLAADEWKKCYGIGCREPLRKRCAAYFRNDKAESGRESINASVNSCGKDVADAKGAKRQFAGDSRIRGDGFADGGKAVSDADEFNGDHSGF